MSKPDGGLVFPHKGKQRIPIGENVWQHIELDHFGLSLRDYFAAQALAGLLADSETEREVETVARGAYAYADAMLKAREEPEC